MVRRRKKFKNYKFNQKIGVIVIFLLIIYIIGSLFFEQQMNSLYEEMGLFKEKVYYSTDVDNIPEYDGESKYVIINNNNPSFNSKDYNKEFENYSNLDSLGRCGVAYANLSPKTMPTEERGNIGSIKPSGWHIIKYEGIDGNYLYNRCHLIGFQLAGENANVKNLITCTRQMNTGVMLNYENLVASYIKKTGNHVLYRITPIYKDKDLVATGVQMEGYSVEDSGEGIKFNIFVYNVQDGIIINYENGDSKRAK